MVIRKGVASQAVQRATAVRLREAVQQLEQVINNTAKTEIMHSSRRNLQQIGLNPLT